MKAVVFHEHGGPERLSYQEVPAPRPGPGQALVRVKACALNHLDIWVRQGIPAYTIPLPHISGCDIAGVVEAVGDGAVGVAPGERVVVSPGVSCWRCAACLAGRDNECASYHLLGAQVDGGYAELVAVPDRNLLPLPKGLSFEEAAAFPLVSVTAWHMLFARAGLRPGETVLVMGAGSGVGSAAVQLARAAGARVLTTVGSEEKVPKALALGAEAALIHGREPLAKRLRELTGGRGVDVVVEHIGPAVWEDCVGALARGGRLVTCGATTGPEVKVDLRALFSRQITLQGSYMGTRAELAQAAALVERGLLKPVVDRVFPLAEARAAQEAMVSRRLFGKLVLSVG